MEVHAHSHSPRKKWTHYLWEFLMLFLAVFSGFLAEYQLEHKIEKQREKKFIRLLAQDLQADIDSIAKIKIHRLERFKQGDSLLNALIKGDYKTRGGDVYYWGRSISRRRFFYSADGTLQQLKSSGSLRLIHNENLVGGIISYDVLYRNYLRQLDVEMENVVQYRITAARIFNAGAFQRVTATTNEIERPPGNPQLLDTSEAGINELANKVNYILAGHLRLTQLLDELSDKAMELLKLIREDYRIK